MSKYLLKVSGMTNTVFLTAVTHHSVNITHSSEEIFFASNGSAEMLPRLRHGIPIYFYYVLHKPFLREKNLVKYEIYTKNNE